MASDFSAAVEQALADKRICGGAAIAIDQRGQPIISKEFGKTSVDEAEARLFTFDTTFWIASSSKLLTSICALQCVEKGLLSLDDDMSNVLPDWKDPDIITGFGDDGKPILAKAKSKITLRRLLTHSSGMAYPDMQPLLMQYRKDLPVDTDTISRFKNPLIHEPGSSWAYSSSIDWAGQLVEVVSGLKLGVYMQKHIFAPLGMTSTTFDPVGDESIMDRMTGRVGRDVETGLVKKEESNEYLVKNTIDHFGGSGLYSTTNDYIKVLRSLLLDDGVLLKKSGDMYEQLFCPNLENPAAFHAWATHPMFGSFIAPGMPRDPATTKWNYGLGGALVMADLEGQAKKGTLYWSGYANNYWFIDRRSGIAGYYGSWIIPPGDAPTGEMFKALQRGALKQVAEVPKL